MSKSQNYRKTEIIPKNGEKQILKQLNNILILTLRLAYTKWILIITTTSNYSLIINTKIIIKVTGSVQHQRAYLIQLSTC